MVPAQPLHSSPMRRRRHAWLTTSGPISTRLIPLAPIAQLDRASDYGSEGREFESLWAHSVVQALTDGQELAPEDDDARALVLAVGGPELNRAAGDRRPVRAASAPRAHALETPRTCPRG